MLDKRPTGYDRIELDIPLAPVSQQASAKIKNDFVTSVRRKFSQCEFLLSGDVSLEIEWFEYEQVRYETDRSPDVDNILKPLIDALSGPAGILIDDNQIQHISCWWMDTNINNERIHIVLKFHPDDWFPKNDLVFIQFERGICFPFHISHDSKLNNITFNRIKNMLEARSSIYRSMLPQQRVFHRTRLHGFKVLDEQSFRSSYLREQSPS